MSSGSTTMVSKYPLLKSVLAIILLFSTTRVCHATAIAVPSNDPGSTPIPSGTTCYYKMVTCVAAPCPKILVCNTPSPSASQSSSPSPSVLPSSLPSPSPSPSVSPTPSVIPSSPPGDATGEGLVDGRDYVVWLGHFKPGEKKSGFATIGDFNNDNYVDGVDYVVWLNHFH